MIYFGSTGFVDENPAMSPYSDAQNLAPLSIKTTDWSQVLRITSKRTAALAFDAEGAPYRPILLWPSLLAETLRIFPNPSSTHEAWVSSEHSGTIAVVDIYGRQQWQGTITQGIPMRLNGLKNGVYAVTLVQNNGKRLTKQLVISSL